MLLPLRNQSDQFFHLCCLSSTSLFSGLLNFEQVIFVTTCEKLVVVVSEQVMWRKNNGCEEHWLEDPDAFFQTKNPIQWAKKPYFGGRNRSFGSVWWFSGQPTLQTWLSVISTPRISRFEQYVRIRPLCFAVHRTPCRFARHHRTRLGFASNLSRTDSACSARCWYRWKLDLRNCTPN